ncbi:tetratricopeptide repeat protein [Candidatus Poribacteria bacterium]|nr:tetratricopeptide repeat protein [Candidatus Poribacteria bacterium]
MDTKTLGIIGGVALIIALLSPLVLGSSKTVEIYYDKAEILFENRKFEEAIKVYQKAIKASKRPGARPKFIDNDFTGLANYKIGLCYEKLGEISDYNRQKYYPIALNHIRKSISNTKEIQHKTNLTFLWAEILYKNKMPLEAGEKYRHFTQLYSKSPLVEEALYKVGLINSNPRNYNVAYEAFNRLIDEFPTSNYRADVEHRLSKLLVDSNNNNKDTVNDNDYNENNQPSDESLYQTAIALKNKGQTHDAYIILNRIISKQESAYLPHAYELIADMMVDVGNYLDARKNYQLAIDNTNNIAHQERLEDKSKDTYFVPDDIDEHVGPKTNNSRLFRKATSLRFYGNYLEAAVLYERLTINNISAENRVFALYWCGYSFFMAGSTNKEHYSKSIDYFDKLIREYENTTYIEKTDLISSYHYLIKAYSYIADGTVDPIEKYGIIIQLVDTVDSRYRANAFGIDLENLNELQEIKRRINGKLKEKTVPDDLTPIPTGVDKLVEEGRIHFNNDNLEESVSLVKKALEINPELEVAELLLSDIKDRYYVRGLSYINKDMLEIGIRELNKCLELDKKDKKVYAKIGFVYIHKGEYEKSIKPIMDAIEIDNQFKEAYYNLAYAYFMLDSLDYALNYVNMALEIDATYEFAKQLRISITE